MATVEQWPWLSMELDELRAWNWLLVNPPKCEVAIMSDEPVNTVIAEQAQVAASAVEVAATAVAATEQAKVESFAHKELDAIEADISALFAKAKAIIKAKL